MKTTMKSAMKAAALLLMATVMTTMTSCSNDDDNGTVTDTTVAGTTLTITPSLPDDCVNTYDNSLIYTDGAGVQHTEKLENGKTITIKSTTAESKGTLVIHQTIKSGVKLEAGTYMYGAKLSFVLTGVNAKGQTVCKSNSQEGNFLYSTTSTKLAETIAKDPMKAQYTIYKTGETQAPLALRVEDVVQQ